MLTERRTVAALDIDQTLAGGVVGVHLKHYNEQLGLGMSEAEIAEAATTYKKTFDVPQIIEYRKRDEEGFQEVRAWIRTSPLVNSELVPITGSLEGTITVHNFVDDVGYFTVRPTEIAETTEEWLYRNHYPNSEQLVISDSHSGKILDVLEASKESDARMVLIDDSLKELLQAAKQLADGNPKITEEFSNLVLVGFGYDDMQIQQTLGKIGESLGIEVYALPSWEAPLVIKLLTELGLKMGE